MQKYQIALILGIGLVCAAGIPFLLPRTAYVGNTLPDPITLSVMIALAGLIVLVISIILKHKPVPAYR